jgi:hypothetical protein
VGVSYKKLPRDYLPPLCSGRYSVFFFGTYFFCRHSIFFEQTDYLPPIIFLLLLWKNAFLELRAKR